jgi:hypothetical protein
VDSGGAGHGDRKGRVFTGEVRPLGAAASETDGSVAATLEVGGWAGREEAVVIVRCGHREEGKEKGRPLV